jgi:uncharacterized protein (DUF488 family)
MSSERGDRPDRDSGEPTATDVARVFTLGYQGRSLQEVLAIVQQHGIAQVLDVRENARSRKPGFSSSDLEAALADAGIAYVHLPQFGCERESRHALWKGSTTREFQDRYRRKLAENRESWPDLTRRIRGSRSLLLCLERDPTQCHRAVLAERLRADGFQVQDL